MDTGLNKILRGWAYRAKLKGAGGMLLSSQNESFTDKDAAEETIWTKYMLYQPVTQTLTAPFFQNNQTFYTHSVSNVAAQTLTVPFFQNTQTFYTHSVSNVAAQTLTVPFFQNTQTFYIHLITNVASNPIVGYGTNSNGYSSAACYGVVPTIPLYHHPSDNAQAGMLMMGKKLYSDAAGTTPVGTANTWWSFNTTGAAANRAASIGGDGTVANIVFQNGTPFGYASQGGDCSTTSFPTVVNNAPDDYPYFYALKAFARSTDQGFFLSDGQWAFAYSGSGPSIGYATMQMVLNYQNTYTTLTSCVVSPPKFFRFISWE